MQFGGYSLQMSSGTDFLNEHFVLSIFRDMHLGDVGGNALLPGLRGQQGRDAFPRIVLRCHCHAAFSDPPALDGCCSLVVAAPAGRSAVASSIYYPGSGIWTGSIAGAFAISLSLLLFLIFF